MCGAAHGAQKCEMCGGVRSVRDDGSRFCLWHESKRSQCSAIAYAFGRWCDVRQSRIAFIEPGMSDASTGPGGTRATARTTVVEAGLISPRTPSRKQVEALASFGVPRSEIAKVAGDLPCHAWEALWRDARHRGDQGQLARRAELVQSRGEGRRSGGDERGDLLAEGPGGLAGEARS